MRLGVLTTGRQDWDILRSTCELLGSDPRFELQVIAGGMHCSPRFGVTLRLVEESGVRVSAAVPWILETSDAIGESARALVGVGEAIGRLQPEALLVVGDRYETAAAALAATLRCVPLAHVHGGEETEGAFDNSLRHAITKLSHLHLVSHPIYAERVIRMGEAPDTVKVVGPPGLDNLFRSDLATRGELESELGVELASPVVVVTVHPATLSADPLADVRAVCAAMREIEARYVITLPNADPGHDAIRAALLEAGRACGGTCVEALGGRRYWGLLRLADAMLGNSSSGVIEAPAIGLPVVNVGDRQKGRLRGRGVVDVPADGAAVATALRTVLREGGRNPRDGAQNSNEMACERIREALLGWKVPRPPVKHGQWAPAPTA